MLVRIGVRTYTLLVGTLISAATMEISVEFTQKPKNRITMKISSTIPEYIPERIKFSI
jgi:hypothetical protein